ncbi:hypothetical protein [Eleftheria terrae]|uniref:hypothetical protein n=1 Tax=Eleftheria terrae TaxID=1597781 RepID=UPI00263B72A9|nr:hypothetical protein [Eleftheria terrae]WKB53147.1 hypothetical protein N7L95_01710 [Eleftheria terrae]
MKRDRRRVPGRPALAEPPGLRPVPAGQVADVRLPGTAAGRHILVHPAREDGSADTSRVLYAVRRVDIDGQRAYLQQIDISQATPPRWKHWPAPAAGRRWLCRDHRPCRPTGWLVDVARAKWQRPAPPLFLLSARQEFGAWAALGLVVLLLGATAPAPGGLAGFLPSRHGLSLLVIALLAARRALRRWLQAPAQRFLRQVEAAFDDDARVPLQAAPPPLDQAAPVPPGLPLRRVEGRVDHALHWYERGAEPEEGIAVDHLRYALTIGGQSYTGCREVAAEQGQHPFFCAGDEVRLLVAEEDGQPVVKAYANLADGHAGSPRELDGEFGVSAVAGFSFWYCLVVMAVCWLASLFGPSEEVDDALAFVAGLHGLGLLPALGQHVEWIGPSRPTLHALGIRGWRDLRARGVALRCRVPRR